jgi:hypothetical protein
MKPNCSVYSTPVKSKIDGATNCHYLDQDFLTCPNDKKSLTGIHLINSNENNNYHYEYTCCDYNQRIDSQNCMLLYNEETDDGGGNCTFLDRQVIQCPEKTQALSSVHLENTSADNAFQYSYTCCPVRIATNKCNTRNTMYTPDDDFGYLDRIPFSCKDYEYLNSYQTKRSEDGTQVRYEYTCCSLYPDSVTLCDVFAKIVSQVTLRLQSLLPDGESVGPFSFTTRDGKQYNFPENDNFFNIKLKQQKVTDDQYDITVSFDTPTVTIKNDFSKWNDIVLTKSDPKNSLLHSYAQGWYRDSSTGYPTCSNAWIDLYFNISSIHIYNINKIEIQQTEEAECIPIVPDTYSYFSMERKGSFPFLCYIPNLILYCEIDASIQQKSGYCVGVWTPCSNPFDACFYDGHCKYGVGNPCPDNQMVLAQGSAGFKLWLYLSLQVTGKATYVYKYSSETKQVTLQDMELSYNPDQFEVKSINYMTQGKDLTGIVLSAIGGIKTVKKMVLPILSESINKMFPFIFTILNENIRDQTFVFTLPNF